jgi:hypothetical protein
MRRLIRTTFARATLAALCSAPVAAISAQAPGTASVFQVSPYAGVMVFGNYLNGPLNTTLTNKPGMLYGTQVGLALSPELSLVGNVGYTSSSLDVGLPILGGVSVGHSSTLIYDADLEYQLGGMRSGTTVLTPFVQAGAGALRYDVNAIDILTTTATNFAANVGVGADIAVGRGVAVRLLAKDYIGKFDFKDAVGFDVSGSTAHNFGLTAGLRFDF